MVGSYRGGLGLAPQPPPAHHPATSTFSVHDLRPSHADKGRLMIAIEITTEPLPPPPPHHFLNTHATSRNYYYYNFRRLLLR